MSKSVSQRSDCLPRPDKVKTSAQNKPTRHNKRVSDCREAAERSREGKKGATEEGMLEVGDKEE